MKSLPNTIKNSALNYTIFFVFIYSLIGFVVIPFSGDIQVFLGGAKMATYYGGNTFFNSIMTWDLKGVFLRLFFCSLYNLVNLFFTCPSNMFSIACSLLYTVFILLITFYVAKSFERIDVLRQRILWAILAIAFFTVDTWCKLQAEMTCVLLLIWAIALMNNTNTKKKFFVLSSIMAGALICCLFWFKTPLILLSISFASAMIIINHENIKETLKKIFFVATCAVIFLVLIGIIVWIVNPDEYNRIFLAAIYQRTLVSGDSFSLLKTIKSFIGGFIRSIITLPVMSLGVTFFVINILEILKAREWKIFILHLLMWGMPAIYVMLSNCYFIYHYYTFAFPAIIEGMLVWRDFYGRIKTKKSYIIYTIYACLAGMLASHVLQPLMYYKYIYLFYSLLLIISIISLIMIKKEKLNFPLHFILSLSLFIFFSYSALLSNNSLAYLKLTNESYKHNFSLPVEKEEQVLYLDAGDGAYYFGYNTFFEEYYPLILQRIDEGSEKSKLDRYVKSSEKILKYDGKFIILTEKFIFPKGKNQTLKEKINKEYQLYTSYNVYFTPTSIFEMQTRNNFHSLLVYKRKIYNEETNESKTLHSNAHLQRRGKYKRSCCIMVSSFVLS